MRPAQAAKVLERYGIHSRDLPEISQAIQALDAADALSDVSKVNPQAASARGSPSQAAVTAAVKAMLDKLGLPPETFVEIREPRKSTSTVRR